MNTYSCQCRNSQQAIFSQVPFSQQVPFYNYIEKYNQFIVYNGISCFIYGILFVLFLLFLFQDFCTELTVTIPSDCFLYPPVKTEKTLDEKTEKILVEKTLEEKTTIKEEK